MGGIIGDGDRHYSGPETMQRYEWKCPRCGTKNTSRFEDGCPSCGAGTEAERIMLSAKLAVGIDELQAIVGRLDFTDYSEKAARTVAHALLYFADHGMASDELMERPQIRAWGQLLLQIVGAGEP